MKRSELTKATKGIVIARRKELVDRCGRYDKAGRSINDSYIVFFPDNLREKYSFPHFDIRVDLYATSRCVRQDGLHIFCSSFKDKYTSLILGFGKTYDYAIANLEFNLTKYVNELIKSPEKFYQYLVDNGFEMKVEPSFFKATDTLSFTWSVTRPIPPTELSMGDERMCSPNGSMEYWDRKNKGFGYSLAGSSSPRLGRGMISVWFPEYPYREAGLFYQKNLNSKKDIIFEDELWDIQRNENVQAKLKELSDEILKLMGVGMDPPEESRAAVHKSQLGWMIESGVIRGTRKAKKFFNEIKTIKNN